MRVIVVTRHGGPEVLEVQDRPAPEPGPGELLVDVEAIGVNYRDVYEREGGGTHAADTPHLAGVEGAGTVAAVGEGADGFAPGDRVAWSNAPGSYAEQVLVAADAAVALPEGISTEVAAAAMLQGSTAHYLATSTYPIQRGDSVLVHAAAGGVGLLLTQIAKRRGGRVIATTSTDEKAELARGAGADETIGYDGFGERARELTGGEGVHAVYDGIGAATFDESLVRAAPARLHGALRRRERAAAAGRDRQAQRGLAVPHPPDAHPLRPRGRRAADARGRAARVDRRGRARRAHRRALPARRTRPARRPISSRARRPGS